MAMRHLCLFLLFGFPCLTVAFGPRFESLKGGVGARTSRKAFTDDEHEEDPLNFKSLRKRGVGYTLHYENRYKEIGGEYFQCRLFISEPFFLDVSLFGIVNPFDTHAGIEDDDILAACGDDCVECAIPEEYKRIASENPIDVMAFLGIRRAEPIRVAGNHHSAGDWE
jgi:hypothetical protein